MPEDDELFPEERREKKRNMFDSSEAQKAVENVLDDDTMDSLLKLRIEILLIGCTEL